MPGLHPRFNETHRVEGFSDAVFAIAATLLVLDLKVPAKGEFLTEILADWPGYLAYLAAFLTIASIWLHHHNLFSRIRKIDARLVAANLLLLLAVAVLPWPTSLLAAALGENHRGDQMVAVAVYGIVSVVVAVAWSILSWSLARHPELLRSPDEVQWMRTNLRRVVLSVVPVVVAVVLALFAPLVSLLIYIAIPVYFFVMSTRPTEPDAEGV